jgi:hypothetical protein
VSAIKRNVSAVGGLRAAQAKVQRVESGQVGLSLSHFMRPRDIEHFVFDVPGGS